jgi:hypothetical protein
MLLTSLGNSSELHNELELHFEPHPWYILKDHDNNDSPSNPVMKC